MFSVSVTFYDLPSSPILIIDALCILVALAVLFIAYQKYFNSPFNKELQQKKKVYFKKKRNQREVRENRERFKESK